MSTTKRKPARVSLPRPTKRARARVALAITMHPTQLDELRTRAESRGMSLTAYVAALLDSDADDVAPARRKFFSLGELASDERLIAAGAHKGHAIAELADARELALKIGVPLIDDDGEPPCTEPDCGAPSYVWRDGTRSRLCAKHTRATLERGE